MFKSLDNAGRVLTEQRPDGLSILYGYDASGNLTSVTPPGGTAHALDYTGVDLDLDSRALGDDLVLAGGTRWNGGRRR